MIYEWKSVETGEVVESEHWSIPPKLPGTWTRVFTFGLGRITGAGASPGRVVKRKRG